jgi:hypothetical protein
MGEPDSCRDRILRSFAKIDFRSHTISHGIIIDFESTLGEKSTDMESSAAFPGRRGTEPRGGPPAPGFAANNRPEPTEMVPRCLTTYVFLAFLASFSTSALSQTDRLPSWNEGPAKRAIVQFVEKVATEGGPGYVPRPERIAVFDNDGTLWCEQPGYVQAAFALDRIRALSGAHPEWREKPFFRAAIGGDMETILKGTTRERLELIAASHAGMTNEEFEQIALSWLATARHPRFRRPYTELVYQPMLELLAYLRANGFKTYIVSGGGVEFMRPWAGKVYGIPPEQVVGSMIKVKYKLKAGLPSLIRLPEVEFVDDREGKPVGIHRAIGRRPIAAFGNSDGDYEMLCWTTAGPSPRLGVIVHHTDAVREWSYDRDSSAGRLARALEEAPARGWVVVDMKSDWKRVFPFDN